jgi:hydrogenase maturation protease
MPDILTEMDEDGRCWPAVVLGMGNVLRRDEGLGIRALQRLAERYAPHDDVRLVDGGTLGLDLLSYLEDAERLLVLDAALTDGPPGTLLRVAGEDVPAFFGMRSSPHEVGLPDLLAVTRLRGTEPPDVVVLGMQPGVIELGWDLSAEVEAQLDALVSSAVDQLHAWGFDLTPVATGEDTMADTSTLEGDALCTK